MMKCIKDCLPSYNFTGEEVISSISYTAATCNNHQQRLPLSSPCMGSSNLCALCRPKSFDLLCNTHHSFCSKTQEKSQPSPQSRLNALLQRSANLLSLKKLTASYPSYHHQMRKTSLQGTSSATKSPSTTVSSGSSVSAGVSSHNDSAPSKPIDCPFTERDENNDDKALYFSSSCTYHHDELKRHYNVATWTMYHRIVLARRAKEEQIILKSCTITTSTTTRIAPHDVLFLEIPQVQEWIQNTVVVRNVGGENTICSANDEDLYGHNGLEGIFVMDDLHI